MYDTAQKSIVLDKHLRFNQSFLINGREHSLFNYINMDVNEFTKNFVDKFDYFQNMIEENLKPGEIINTRPEIMLINREFSVDSKETFDVIETKYNINILLVPLKLFLGNISKRKNIRKKEPSLIILASKNK